MTHPTPTTEAAELPEALITLIDEYAEAHHVNGSYMFSVRTDFARAKVFAELRRLHVLTTSHVQKPSEIEHVVSDVSETTDESSPTHAISAELAGAGYAALSTPGEWFVRYNADKTDCFVAAPDCKGYAYDAEILGDDEYTTTNAEYDRGDFDAGIKRKTADCELIVAAVKAWRTSHGQAPAQPTPQAADTPAQQPAPAQEVDIADEHPAARRMREDFEREYGRHHPIARAIRLYYDTRKGYDDAWNRDREAPVTFEDVSQAEREVFRAADSVMAAQGAGITAVGGLPSDAMVLAALRDAMENGQLVLMELIYRGNEKKERIAEQRRVVAHAQAALAGAGADVLEPLQRRKNEY